MQRGGPLPSRPARSAAGRPHPPSVGPQRAGGHLRHLRCQRLLVLSHGCFLAPNKCFLTLLRGWLPATWRMPAAAPLPSHQVLPCSCPAPAAATELYWFVCFNAPADAASQPASPAAWREEALAVVKGWAWGLPEAVQATPLEDLSRSRLVDRWVGREGLGRAGMGGPACPPAASVTTVD